MNIEEITIVDISVIYDWINIRFHRKSDNYSLTQKFKINERGCTINLALDRDKEKADD